jgi:hypothetical protein
LVAAFGTFDVYRVENKKFLTPVPIRSNPVISKGTDVTNEISVTVNGNKSTLAINDKKVIEFTGQPAEGGSQFGFWVGADKGDTGPSTFILKSFQLREIGSTPTPVGQNACLDKCQAEANACNSQAGCSAKRTECFANCKGDLRCKSQCLLTFNACMDPCFTKFGACQTGCGGPIAR